MIQVMTKTSEYYFYTRLLKQNLVEIQYYAKRNTPLAKSIMEYLIEEAERFRKKRDSCKEDAGRLLQAAVQSDWNE